LNCFIEAQIEYGNKINQKERRMTSTEDVKAIIAALDSEYQAAVKNNDAATMDRILADDFILVTGRGKVFDKTALLDTAKNQEIIYEHQEDFQQTVRVWGDTAVITALLWQTGLNQGVPFDDYLWFSDTYVRSPDGWRYVFGQASIRLPD
jgi:ketosteroid isomerase-like protein